MNVRRTKVFIPLAAALAVFGAVGAGPVSASASETPLSTAARHQRATTSDSEGDWLYHWIFNRDWTDVCLQVRGGSLDDGVLATAATYARNARAQAPVFLSGGKPGPIGEPATVRCTHLPAKASS
jgi:hypothetical protein